MTAKTLNPKQQCFVDEYLIDRNATQAAIRAKYSPRTAESQASRLLTNVNVVAAVKKGIAKLEKRTEISQDYVINNIKEITERCMQVSVVRDYDGEPEMVEMPDGQEVVAVKFDAHNALKGNELLGKHLNMFGNDTAINVQAVVFNLNFQGRAQ